MIKIFYLILFLLFTNLYAKTQKIIVWNYYNSPPFITEKNKGFAQDFVNFLNAQKNSKYEFILSNIPRKRLNIYLEAKRQGIVLFVNPVWMGKDASTKYLWTESFLSDQNEIISSKINKIHFKNTEELKNLTFVAIRGRKYKGFEKMFKNEEIKKIIVEKEQQSLLLLSLNRADLTSQPRTIAKPLIKELELEDKLFISPTPLFKFTRHIMITRPQYELHKYLSLLVKDLENKKQWKAILEKYNLQ